MYLHAGVYSSPIGNIVIKCTAKAIVSVAFATDTADKPSLEQPTPILLEAYRQLNLYFTRQLLKFDLPTMVNTTEFQNKVYAEVLEIPFGQIISYAQLAKRMGSSLLTRAVASANGANPLLLIIPCHRVIGKNGSLTGYAGETWRKEWLLKHENASGYLSL